MTEITRWPGGDAGDTTHAACTTCGHGNATDAPRCAGCGAAGWAETALLPCPFCGESSEYGMVVVEVVRPGDQRRMHCQNCMALGPIAPWLMAAWDAWNARAANDLYALRRMLADEQAAHAAARQAIAAHRRAATWWTNHAGALTDQLVAALALLDEVKAGGNLWPKQKERVLEIKAVLAALYRNAGNGTTTSGQDQPAAGKEA